MKGFHYKKAVQALNYFACLKGGSLNKMKGLKLIWLSDRFHLRKYGRTITGDSYYALKFGPVASKTKDILDNSYYMGAQELEYSNQFLTKDNYEYASLNPPLLKVFSKTDMEAFDSVLNAFGDLNEFQLSELSHNFPEWKKFEAQLDAHGSRYPMDLLDFFKDNPTGIALFVDEEEDIILMESLFTRKEKSNC